MYAEAVADLCSNANTQGQKSLIIILFHVYPTPARHDHHADARYITAKVLV